MSILSEFKEFAVNGNMIDIAVGLIMGAAFGGLVGSLVSDVIMPPIGVAVNGVDFSSIGPVLHPAGPDGKGAIIWGIGKFINTIINFVIVAAAVFLLVKAVNAMKRAPAEPAAPPAPPRQEVLLQEIRDALLKR